VCVYHYVHATVEMGRTPRPRSLSLSRRRLPCSAHEHGRCTLPGVAGVNAEVTQCSAIAAYLDQEAMATSVSKGVRLSKGNDMASSANRIAKNLMGLVEDDTTPLISHRLARLRDELAAIRTLYLLDLLLLNEPLDVLRHPLVF
jgi:hypothetical protein